MHCELMLPGLYYAPAAPRLPALEMLLARGRRTVSEPRSAEGWLQEAFGVDAGELPAGALTVLARHGAPGSERWARADPVHLRLLRDRLVLVPNEAFALSQEEADALCEALNRHFAGALEVRALEPRRWCARLAEDFGALPAAPLDLAGRDADLGRPLGDGARRWQALLTEAQMVLHAHPVNLAREQRGEPAVNSLWLWGAGAVPGELPRKWQTVAAAEPLALGLAQLSGARPRPLPGSADAWLDSLPEDGRQLALLDALRAARALSQEAEYAECLAALESRWFAPLLAALRRGRIGMLTLHLSDLGHAFETIRGDLRRLWRRPRALERYA
jgi:hypothetical protein